MIARGSTAAAPTVTLASPLPDVSNEAWTRFVQLCAQASLRSVSASNALGMFEMFPRRLADLKLVENLRRTKAKSGRTVWTGRFVTPLTAEAFLTDARTQYRVFCLSMLDYAKQIASGKISVSSTCGLTMSGVLALLHRCGPRGVDSWMKGNSFEATRQFVERAQGVF